MFARAQVPSALPTELILKPQGLLTAPPSPSPQSSKGTARPRPDPGGFLSLGSQIPRPDLHIPGCFWVLMEIDFSA